MNSFEGWPEKMNSVRVHTPSGLSGALSFERGSYAFSYGEQSEEVSLTMPRRVASYNSGALHPVFQMNIPEGYVRKRLTEKLRRYIKVNDMLFLALQQNRGIGSYAFSWLWRESAFAQS